MRSAVTIEELPHRRPHDRNIAFFLQSLNHLVERRVRRLCKQAEDEVRMRIKHGALRLALFGRANVARCPLQPRPCPRCRNADRKTRCRLGSLRTSSKLIPEEGSAPGFDIA
jgi:hypothetical protein